MLNNWHYGKGELRRYGNDDISYKKAADYLDQAGLVVEDWGCGAAYGRQFFKESLYFGIDGGTSDLIDKQVDLRAYTSDVDCILMRHVLEHNNEWEKVLLNAMSSFRKKMVLIIFTPFETETKTININQPAEDFLVDAVPSISFKKEDLLKYFSQYSYTEESLETQTEYGVETIFYINKEDEPASRHSIFDQSNKEVLEPKKVPRVSVVVPCYNYGHYLSGTLYSVLNQTLQDFEIIIVDDGSSEQYTKKIISKISHPKIKVIAQDNRGLSAARNAGIREARGEFIVPLDADDKLHPTYLEKCLWMLEHNPQIGFVYTATQTFGDYEYIWYENYNLSELLKRNLIPATAMYRKRDWQEVGGYNESLIAYEDWELWLYFAERRIYGALLPEPLFLYRKHTPSMLKTVGEPNLLNISQKICELHPGLYLEKKDDSSHHFSGSLPPETIFSAVEALRRSQDQLRDYQLKIKAVEEALGTLEKNFQKSQAELEKRVGELASIYRSRGWKIISFLHRIRTKLPFLKKL